MPRTDAKGLSAALKKDGFSRIYYLFGADVAGIEKMTKQLVKAVVGDNADIALTKLNGRELDIPGLQDIIQMAPMLSEYNCILINDYNCERPYDDMRGRNAADINNSLIAALKDIPEYTVVIFNITGFEIKTKRDFRSGASIITDKNKKLADFAQKNGVLCEVGMKTSAELSKTIASKISARGSVISLDNAKTLAELCLCDELVIGNEIEKLCAYADGREITSDMLRELVHAQNDTTVYNLANAAAAMNRKAAFDALAELNIDSENRGAALYALTGAFLDLYRASCAKAAGVLPETAAVDFGYGEKRTFVMNNAFRDSQRISIERLRSCITILRDTAVQLNSTGADARIAIEQAVTKMLTSGQRRKK